MHTLLAIIVALVTVAPFVPNTHLVGNFAYGDIMVMISLMWFAITSGFRLMLPSKALWPIAIGIISLASLTYQIALGKAEGSILEIGYIARWFYFGLLIIFIAVSSRIDKYAPGTVLYGCLFGVMITALWGWWVWFQAPMFIFGIPMLHVIKDTDWLINRNYIGYFLGIGVVLAFALALIEVRKGWKLLSYIAFVFLAFSAFSSMSKGTWLAAFVPILGYWLHCLIEGRGGNTFKKIKRAGLMATFFAVVAINTEYPYRYAYAVFDRIEASKYTNTVRLQYAREASSIMLQHPLLGVGPKRYREASIAKGMSPTTDPHNAVLWVGAELGMPAALILVAMLASIGLFLFRKARVSGAKIWFPVQMVYVSILLTVPVHGLSFSGKYLWILIGLAVGIATYQRRIRQ